LSTGVKIQRPGRKVVDEIRSKGGKAEFLVANLMEPDSVVELFERLGKRAESLDILINNAVSSVRPIALDYRPGNSSRRRPSGCGNGVADAVAGSAGSAGSADNVGNAGLPDEASGVSNDGRSRVAPTTPTTPVTPTANGQPPTANRQRPTANQRISMQSP
jgi:hypothetical protein